MVVPTYRKVKENTTLIQSIITIRNREAGRIEALVDSLQSKGAETEFLVVDYGSDQGYAADYRSLEAQGLVRVLRLETQGRPWNKCHAINAGVRATTSPWIATIDVDMVFDCNPFPYCLANDPLKKVQVMQASFLPPSGDKSRATHGGFGHPGGFVFQSRQAFGDSGGYDERIRYWGHEDWDWVRRLGLLGYSLEWLPREYEFFHVWHPVDHSTLKRPAGASFDTAQACAENLVIPQIQAFGGRLVTKEDRPILGCFNHPSWFPVPMEPNTWSERLPDLVRAVATHQTIHVKLGGRRIRRKLDRWRPLAEAFSSFLSPFGISFGPLLNANLDFWYATQGALEKAGVVDWFLSTDLEDLYLYSGAFAGQGTVTPASDLGAPKLDSKGTRG